MTRIRYEVQACVIGLLVDFQNRDSLNFQPICVGHFPVQKFCHGHNRDFENQNSCTNYLFYLIDVRIKKIFLGHESDMGEHIDLEIEI